MINILKKASDLTYIIAKWIMFAYVLGVTILAIVGVFFRTMGSALSWNEELMRWLLIGIAYIGASVALKVQNHIGIEYFLLKMNKRTMKIAIIVGYIAIIVFLVITTKYTFQTALLSRRQYGAILRVPMIWVKMNLPLGSIFMIVHMTYFFAGILREKENFRPYMISGGQEGEIKQ